MVRKKEKKPLPYTKSINTLCLCDSYYFNGHFLYFLVRV